MSESEHLWKLQGTAGGTGASEMILKLDKTWVSFHLRPILELGVLM